MNSNPHYSATLARSQRGHTLAGDGPYRFMRHPGYAGFIISWLGAPMLLGSLWALVPSLIGCWLTVVRTATEDRILHEELPGYSQYAQSVRFRLLPGVW
jgi:protein-S-isoprenylcysteine O-methyltransferase Ste14